MDFDPFGWQKQKPDQEIARAIRRDIHLHRRERGRGGHRYRFATLKSLWTVDIIHAVLNHKDDPVWQRYYNHPSQGWLLVDWYMTRREAQAAAELPLPEDILRPTPALAPEIGWHVYAGWQSSKWTMDVPCSSWETACEIDAVFAEIGCYATKTLVVPPLLDCGLG